MNISDDDVNTLLQRTARMEFDQKRLLRTVYGDDEYKGLRTLVNETAAKADRIDNKIIGYEARIQGAKWVVGGLAFLLTSGALAAIINVITGG